MEQTVKLKQDFWNYWDLFIEELQSMIFEKDLNNIQCLIDSFNLEISKIIKILTETFDVTLNQQEDVQSIRLSKPFSKFFSNQSLEVFLVSKDLSQYDVKLEATTDLDIKIDPGTVKLEDPEDEVENGDAKWAHHRKYYVSKCYKPEYPISEEEYKYDFKGASLRLSKMSQSLQRQKINRKTFAEEMCWNSHDFAQMEKDQRKGVLLSNSRL